MLVMVISNLAGLDKGSPVDWGFNMSINCPVQDLLR